MLKDYKTEYIQNVLIAGHGQVGKTTLTESLLVAGGALPEAGAVDKGTTVSDFDEEEIERKASIRTSLSFIEPKGKKINLLDAPGSPDFIGEVRAALHVVDSMLMVVDAEVGAQIETVKQSRCAVDFKVPRVAFINRMDKENANFTTAMDSIGQKLDKPALAVWLPIGAGADFKGAVDLLSMKALLFTPAAKTPKVEAIPSDLEAAAQSARDKLIEAAAEGDDALTEKFLDGQSLSDQEICKGLNEVILSGLYIPVLCGCGNRVSCAAPLIDFMLQVLPHAGQTSTPAGFEPGSPEKALQRKARADEPFSAYVYQTLIDQYAGKFSFFRVISGAVVSDQDVVNTKLNKKERFSHLYVMLGKKPLEVPKVIAGDLAVIAKSETTQTGHTFADPSQPIEYPPLRMPQAVYSVSVSVVKKAEEQKMATALARLCEEDPTLSFHFEAEAHQSLLSAMGDLQIDITLAKLKKKYNVEVERGIPRVLYKETIQKTAPGHHKHKKQTGGHGQYGDVYLEIAPLERGAGYSFEDVTVGGCIPKGYIPGVEKGVKEALLRGVLAKYPVIDVGIKVTDGSYHDVDSSEMSFKIAGRKAFFDAMQKASPVLLEPVMHVKIMADESYMGAITSDLNSRRGRILAMGTGEIEAHIPQASLLTYSMDLKAMTSGTATFEMVFSHFQPISGRIAENVIKEAAVLHGEEKEED